MRADNGWSASTWVGRPATVISVPTNCAGPGAVRVEFDVDSDSWPDVTVSVRQCRRLVKRAPREYWLTMLKGSGHFGAAYTSPPKSILSDYEIVHVREVRSVKSCGVKNAD